MATGGEPSDAFVEATGSEAVLDHVCGPCSDGQTKEAVGLCVDCDDWLCDECYRAHKIPKPLRHHILKSAEEMKNSTQGLTAAVDKCTEKCDRHDDKRITYFCKDHDYLGCSKCVIENHRTCDVQNIPDISTDVATKTEFQQTTADLETIAKQSKEIVTYVKKKMVLVKQNKNETVKAFLKYKKEVVELLDKIEGVVADKCGKKEEEETDRLEKIAETCRELEKASLQTKGQLEVYEDRGQHCNMFVAIKKSRNKVRTMKDTIRKAQDSSSVTMYTFQPNLKIGEILKGPEGLGTLVEKGQKRSDKDYSKVQAKHLIDISVKSNVDGTCAIIGSALLPGHNLVLTDLNNYEVKVIDTNKNKLLSKTKIDGCPWAVCKISDNSVAVTVYNKNRLLFLSVNDTGKLATTKTLAFSGQCFGVAATDDRIIVTYTCPDRMEIMDMNGSILQAFEANHQGQQILASPRYVSVSPDKKSVYVSNCSNSTVTCMSLDGTVTAVYRDDELQYPAQATVDSNGMVYVAGYSSSNVHLITQDCTKIKVVLNESDGLKYVHAVSYCDESRKLYVGMGGCDVIKVFQLT